MIGWRALDRLERCDAIWRSKRRLGARSHDWPRSTAGIGASRSLLSFFVVPGLGRVYVRRFCALFAETSFACLSFSPPAPPTSAPATPRVSFLCALFPVVALRCLSGVVHGLRSDRPACRCFGHDCNLFLSRLNYPRFSRTTRRWPACNPTPIPALTNRRRHPQTHHDFQARHSQPWPPPRTNSKTPILRRLLFPLAIMSCATTTQRRMHHDLPHHKNHT